MNTPLTDAQIGITEAHNPAKPVVQADFARKLERDRARLIDFIQAHALGEASHALLLSLEADK